MASNKRVAADPPMPEIPWKTKKPKSTSGDLLPAAEVDPPILRQCELCGVAPAAGGGGANAEQCHECQERYKEPVAVESVAAVEEKKEDPSISVEGLDQEEVLWALFMAAMCEYTRGSRTFDEKELKLAAEDIRRATWATTPIIKIGVIPICVTFKYGFLELPGYCQLYPKINVGQLVAALRAKAQYIESRQILHSPAYSSTSPSYVPPTQPDPPSLSI
jgi:hypothetical protein